MGVERQIPGEKIAPVQGYSAGIPWSMHLRAYDAYCKKWGPQKALIDLEGRNCRGGFSTGELDDFIPGWREELSEITQLQKRIADLAAEVERLQGKWKLLPDEQAWWWHWTAEDLAIPFIYHVQKSGTNGRYFIDYPDSRWCDEIVGF